jgi:UDP-N-acetylglucosamine 2-epimerase (non-hydrolysing)
LKTIATVIGTRPEAVKLAPVVLRLAQTAGVRSHVCLTAQHREMLDQVLGVFEIAADSDLNLMRPDQTLATLAARAIEGLDRLFAEARPDLVLVQGDTTTVFCATLAAFYRRIPVGHVEAGLRTGDLSSPWPEEANRVLTTRLAALHFAPTAWARDNLLREGVAPGTVAVTGNTGIDALFLTLERLRDRRPEGPDEPWRRPGTRSVLITAHRRENFGDRFVALCEAIADLAGRFPEVHFIYPVHPNPNVLAPVRGILGDHSDPRLAVGNVHLIEPLSYPQFVERMDACTLILTDSGGVQEEAPSLGKPVLVLRDTTERPEAVQAGTVKLVGTDRELIVREATTLLIDPEAYARMTHRHNPYGDGQAAARIVDRCLAFLGLGREGAAHPAA